MDEKTLWKNKKKFGEEADEIQEKLTNFLNSSFAQEKIEVLVDEFDREHRTLKQSFMNFIMRYLEKQAENEEKGYFDGRDEQACKLAKKIVENTDKYERNLPLI